MGGAHCSELTVAPRRVTALQFPAQFVRDTGHTLRHGVVEARGRHERDVQRHAARQRRQQQLARADVRFHDYGVHNHNTTTSNISQYGAAELSSGAGGAGHTYGDAPPRRLLAYNQTSLAGRARSCRRHRLRPRARRT